MADKAGLQMIGWVMGAFTAAVMLIATILVHDAVANPTAGGSVPALTTTAE